MLSRLNKEPMQEAGLVRSEGDPAGVRTEGARPTLQVRVMDGVLRVLRLIWYVITFCVNFAHGGLVVAGIIVITVACYQIGRSGMQGLNPKFLFGKPVASSVQSPVAGDIVRLTGADGQRIRLNPALTKIALAIARRHHISPLVAESLVWMVQQEGQKQGVDPLLILSVITVESGFNPFLENPFGAQGLMQVIPRLHADMVSGDKGAALMDPAENIRVGTLILKSYLARASGVEVALQDYGGSSSNPDINYGQHVLQEFEHFRLLAGVSSSPMQTGRAP